MLELDDKALQYFLKEMQPQYIKRVGYNALTAAGKKVVSVAKRGYKLTTKGYSKSSNQNVLKSFKVKRSKKEVAVWVGSEYYKTRWLEKGTKERYTKGYRRKSTMGLFRRMKKTKLYRGKIEGSNFFSNALNSVQSELPDIIKDRLKISINKIIEKANKEGGK